MTPFVFPLSFPQLSSSAMTLLMVVGHSVQGRCETRDEWRTHLLGLIAYAPSLKKAAVGVKGRLGGRQSIAMANCDQVWRGDSYHKYERIRHRSSDFRAFA